MGTLLPSPGAATLRTGQSALETIPSPERIRRLSSLLSSERAAIEGAHRAGASGTAVVRMLSHLMDRVIAEVAAAAIADVAGAPVEEGANGRGRSDGAPAWALVALGGYGRSELCPFSDVDLMLLHRPATRPETEALARPLFRTLWDLRLHLGHSVRTVGECLELAGRDLATWTALLDARLLLGEAALFEELAKGLRGGSARQAGERVRRLVAEMQQVSSKHGSSLYLLEPNVKKSGGGLRTIHFVRWIALARYGTGDLGLLHARGRLAAAEGRALRQAHEFYLRVRNDLHFAAGHPADTVSFDDQLRLARTFGYRDDGDRLGVERFMQQYYIHATAVDEIAQRFVAGALEEPLRKRILRRALARTAAGIFLVGPEEVTVSAANRSRLLADPLAIYDLFGVAQLHGRRIGAELLDAVRSALEVQDEAGFRAPGVTRRFVDILSHPGRLADTLSLMHRTGALEKLLPEFAAVNRLVQFNRFHKYTVDEHTFMVIRTAEALLDGSTEVPPGHGLAPGRGTHLRKAYRQVKRKDILHLAMLLHDVGKGHGGDHSASGAAIAAAVARRLGYTEQEARLVVFLVREHLTMEQVALRRDLSEDRILLRFVRTVANPETLRMLFVLTYADIAGVGPGSWTQWKEELVTQLYVRAMDELTGSREVPSPAERVAVLAERARARIGAGTSAQWLEAQWRVMNERYLLVTPLETIVRHLEWLAELAPGGVLVKAENQAETRTTVYTVLTFDGIRPGLFSKIAGVLAAKGLQVLRAQLDTRANGVVVDTFDVSDTFYAGLPPAERLEEVSAAIRDVLLGRASVEELFARHRRFQPEPAAEQLLDPTRVEVDNDSSDAFTVIEVFAHDRQGLLYVIARTIWELGLSVHAAKVATRLDQILDVFYVTDGDGRRIEDPGRIETVRKTLVERIETYEGVASASALSRTGRGGG